MMRSLRFPAMLRPGDAFPDPATALAEPDGLLAIGGDLSLDSLRRAYAAGIFPWFGPDEPILWWSPDPRALLDPAALRIRRSLRKRLRHSGFEVSVDRAFDRVIAACAAPRAPEGNERDAMGADGGTSAACSASELAENRAPQAPSALSASSAPGGVGGQAPAAQPPAGWQHTWIVPAMQQAFGRLHAAGDAHSIEVWRGESLVGGLYGVAVGRMFCGESMFHLERDASKVALAWLCANLIDWGFEWIDVQQDTAHLRSLGACPVPRARYLELLRAFGREAPHAAAWTALRPPL